MKLIVLLGFVALCFCFCEARIQLRLTEGKHKYEGRVEAFVAGKWGPISGKSWTKKAAQVVCRQMGFGGEVIRYTRGVTYGHPKSPRPVWLEKVNCEGTESHIDECDHSGWVERERRLPPLNFYDLAGVMCYSKEGRAIVPPVHSAWAATDTTKLNFWLDGELENGIVNAGYLRLSRNNIDGYVCADDWNYSNMRVACGHLGFPEAHKFRAMQSNWQFILSGVNCEGKESSLFSCNHNGFGSNQQKCRSSAAVWLKCQVFSRTAKFKNSANLKLRGAAVPSSGRVELKWEHSWANLCDDKWNLLTANAICRTLGYGTASEASYAGKYGLGTQLSIVEDIKCLGHESDISDCKWTVLKRTNCSHFEDAGVQCNAPKYGLKEVRLRGGRNSSEGRVELKINGKWGTICGDHWHIKAAMAVCRELGLNFAEKNITGREFGVGDLTMVMSRPICIGDEESLTQCLYDKNFTCSSPGNVAAVRCTDALPDLALSIRDIIKTLRVDYLPLNMLRCAYEENCLASTATRYMAYIDYYTRRLMRFSTVILNYGSADYRPFAKKEDWIWHSCHKHYHSQEEFATYDLLSADQTEKIAEGHKASFCLEDTGCLNGVDSKFNCTAGTQGISVNCYDDYSYSVDCQWIDLTDVPYDRTYIFHVNINPKFEVPETDFDNNVIVCKIFDKGSFIRVRDCGYDYCTSGLRSHGGNANRACCVFPFKYRGVWYETCTKSGFARYWCSTTEQYDDDRKWGLC